MSTNPSGKELILNILEDKSVNKQDIYQNSLQQFVVFKEVMKSLVDGLHEGLSSGAREKVQVKFHNMGDFEAQLQVAGDVLHFTLHSNVFSFDENHFIHKNSYVQEDSKRSYCSMIQVHNFLADSLKYNRMHDIGYLVARIFINKENHYFVEGKRQLGFLYNDFANSVINAEVMCSIIESAILYVVDFDLLVPPYEAVKQITVNQKILQSGNAAFKTGKRLGFSFKVDSDKL